MLTAERHKEPILFQVLILIPFALLIALPARYFAMIAGAPVLFPSAFGSSILINYTVFHRSCDDDTVLDRVRRFFIAVAKGT